MALLNTYSAKNAKVRYGNVVLTAKKWTVTPKADKLDSTHFEGGGFGEKKTGIREVTFVIELDDNGDLSYFDAGLTTGAIVTSVKLYLNDTAGPYWSFPYAWIEGTPMNADVKQLMGLTIQGESNGPYANPTGVAGSTT